MPTIAPFHPILVHFVIGLGFAGVALRLASLSGRLSWTRPAATGLLLTAALASVLAAQSGIQAHPPAEHIPGAEHAVHEHEELGERTRNLFLAVAALEVAALALYRRPGVVRGLHAASALVGIAAGVVLYQAAAQGGLLVYSYAGGVGTRTGRAEDVQRLLVAGLFHQARAAREAGRADEAARLTAELARQLPDDRDVNLLVIESTLRDRNQPDSALAALDALAPSESPGVTISRGLLRSQALVDLGRSDSARAVLNDLSSRYPTSRWVKEAIARFP